MSEDLAYLLVGADGDGLSGADWSAVAADLPQVVDNLRRRGVPPYMVAGHECYRLLLRRGDERHEHLVRLARPEAPLDWRQPAGSAHRAREGGSR